MSLLVIGEQCSGTCLLYYVRVAGKSLSLQLFVFSVSTFVMKVSGGIWMKMECEKSARSESSSLSECLWRGIEQYIVCYIFCVFGQLWYPFIRWFSGWPWGLCISLENICYKVRRTDESGMQSNYNSSLTQCWCQNHWAFFEMLYSDMELWTTPLSNENNGYPIEMRHPNNPHLNVVCRVRMFP